MIKALGGDPAEPLLVIGLSDENWQRLRAGQPITFDLDALRPGVRARRVLLLGGPTEDSIMDDLRALGRVTVHPGDGT